MTPLSSGPPAVIALSGNPRRSSRTVTVARAVAGHVAALAGPGSAAVSEIELADLTGEVFSADRPGVEAALSALAGARVVVVATPVYKASYTGLLKAFLDLYGPDGLAGVAAVPVVVSASPAHALVGEVHLRPLLVELGAAVPTRAFSVTERQLDGLEGLVDRWAVAATPLLRLFLSAPAPNADEPVLSLAGAR